MVAMRCSCDDTPYIGDPTSAKTEVLLTPGFFGFLDEFHQNVNRSTKITISVDRYTGSGTFESNYSTRIYPNIGNDFTTNPSQNNTFEIDVPSSGAFAVTATVDTEECYTLISGESCDYVKGRALYRGASAHYSPDNAPSLIEITPTEALIY